MAFNGQYDEWEVKKFKELLCDHQYKSWKMVSHNVNFLECKCDTCGKILEYKENLFIHWRIEHGR